LALYVDGFVLVVPSDELDAHRAIAEKGGDDVFDHADGLRPLRGAGRPALMVP
jgi:uncharacterized protein YbaA (DUF1428 family)